jgi:hypothetical protein
MKLLVATLLGAGLVGATAFAGSLVVAAMTAVGALAAGPSQWLLLALLLTVLVSGLAVAGAAGALAWRGLASVQTAAVAGRRRLLWTGYRRAREFEDDHALGRLLRPSRLFTASAERDGALVDALQSRYVAGELDELAFERELGRLLGDGASFGREVREELSVTASDGGPGGDATTATDGERETESDRERDAERA